MTLLLLLIHLIPWLLQSAPLPHIIFLVIDDLGYTDLGYHDAEFKTKNLDSLATSGIDLTNYYTQFVCTPTRTSFMTGLYPWRIGMQTPTTLMPGCLAHIPFDKPTLAEQLKSVGYNTQMIGKWHLGYAAYNMTPTGRGFNDFLGYYNGAEDYYSHEINAGYDLVYNNVAQKQEVGIYGADTFFGYYFEYLLNNYNISNSNYNKQALFMYLALQTIHAPIEKAPLINMNGVNMTDLYFTECGHINNTMRRWYCEKLQYIDVYIGDIIELYKNLNLWDNTLFITTTDNGGMPNHNQTDNNPLGNFTVSCGQNYPLRAGKATLFEGGVKGLSFISGPLIPPQLIGTKNNNLFGAIDWFPSILSYIGYSSKIPSSIDGVNIIDNLFYNKTFERTKLILYSNFDIIQDVIVGSIIAGGIIENGWKYIYGNQLYYCYYPSPPQDIICLNNSNGKFITNEYLFNLNNDPYEMNNLIDEYTEKKDYLISLLYEDAINNGYVFNDIVVTFNASCPQFHNGSWLSWLDKPHNDLVVPFC